LDVVGKMFHAAVIGAAKFLDEGGMAGLYLQNNEGHALGRQIPTNFLPARLFGRNLSHFSTIKSALKYHIFEKTLNRADKTAIDTCNCLKFSRFSFNRRIDSEAGYGGAPQEESQWICDLHFVWWTEAVNLITFSHGFGAEGMFQFFPKDKRGWLRVLIFPFQAYVVEAFVVEQHYYGRGSYGSHLADFGALFLLGFVVSFPVLLFVGIAQMFNGHPLRGYVNLGLAVLAGWFICSMNFVVA
jgi:hypothetical protein